MIMTQQTDTLGRLVRSEKIIGTYHNVIGISWRLVRDTYHQVVMANTEKPQQVVVHADDIKDW
jgi:hypothetical protein